MKIMIENARLAFPNLWQPRAATDGGKAKYGASLILDTSNPVIAKLELAFTQIAKEKWGDKAAAILELTQGPFWERGGEP